MGPAKNFFDIGKTAHPFGKAAGAAPYLQTDRFLEFFTVQLAFGLTLVQTPR